MAAAAITVNAASVMLLLFESMHNFDIVAGCKLNCCQLIVNILRFEKSVNWGLWSRQNPEIF